MRQKEKPLRQQDMILSVEKTKQELEECIDYENKRSNIDSAKKRSVLYGYDYEGFRQMVLGAHLFGIKSKELMRFSEGGDVFNVHNKNTVLNSEVLTLNNVNDLSMRNQGETQNFNMIVAEQLANSELRGKNFREFRKNFDKFYKEDLDEVSAQTTYMLLKAQSKENLKFIFSMDFDICYFVKIINVLKFVFEKAILVQKNCEEVEFMLTFLFELSLLKDFQFSIPGFLSKKEKEYLKDFIKQLEQQIKETFSSEQIPQQIFEQVLKYYSK